MTKNTGMYFTATIKDHQVLTCVQAKFLRIQISQNFPEFSSTISPLERTVAFLFQLMVCVTEEDGWDGDRWYTAEHQKEMKEKLIIEQWSAVQDPWSMMIIFFIILFILFLF